MADKTLAQELEEVKAFHQEATWTEIHGISRHAENKYRVTTHRDEFYVNVERGPDGNIISTTVSYH